MRFALVTLSFSVMAGAATAQFPDVLSDEECRGCAGALVSLPSVEGTWSSVLTAPRDVDWESADFFCFVACTAEARARAAALLTKPHPLSDLYQDVVEANHRHATSLLKPAARAHAVAVRDALGSPSFACDPHGFAAQVVSGLPLVIERRGVEWLLRYEEFGVVRSLAPSPTADRGGSVGRFGRSTARQEDATLVVETVGLSAGRFHDWFGGARHSDQLRAIERYTPSADGRWLNLELTLEDPETLERPLVLYKRWRRAPNVRLARYTCDVMGGQLRSVFSDYVDPRLLEARRERR